METHDLLIHSPEMNPNASAYNDFDCPVIDPTDTDTWCWNGPDFYAVPCKCTHNRIGLEFLKMKFLKKRG